MDGSGLVRQIVAQAWSASHYSRWAALIADGRRDAALRDNFRKLCLAHSQSNPSASWLDFMEAQEQEAGTGPADTRPASSYILDTLEDDFNESQAAVRSWLPLAPPGDRPGETDRPVLPSAGGAAPPLSPQLTVEGLTQLGYQVHQLVVSHQGTVSSLAMCGKDALPQFGQAFDVRVKLPLN